MTYTYNNKGTCSVRTVVELNDDHTIKSVQVLGGCDGPSAAAAHLAGAYRMRPYILPTRLITIKGASHGLLPLPSRYRNAAAQKA